MTKSDPLFSGDRPLEKEGEDRLGFVTAAQNIASSILHFASPDGFVFGIEGAWGSGKTSLVNIIVKMLKADATRPEIVKFSPWLIKSRDGLLRELFDEIGNAANAINSDEGKLAEQNKLQKGLKVFSTSLRYLESAAQLAEDFGVPTAKAVHKITKHANETLKEFTEPPPLEKQKDKLKKELMKLSRKILIVIDDLDRLEPSEAAEVVRLVRAVADFPNIIYLLCYDREILSYSLQNALKLKDGATYLDKVLQVTFSVPKPEDFDLRRWCWEEIKILYPNTFSVEEDFSAQEVTSRLLQVVNGEGGRTLSTPRTVVRAINAIRLYGHSIIDKIDLADMAWLQFVRLRNVQLYEWIEEYMNNIAAISQGASVTKFDATNMSKNLQRILNEEKRDLRMAMFELQTILPGINYSGTSSDGWEWAVFSDLRKKDYVPFISRKRLGSPQHYRLYFALTPPKEVITDDDFILFLSLCENMPKKASEWLKKKSSTRRPQGGTVADALVDRLLGDGLDLVEAAALPGLLMALADNMDLAAKNSDEGEFGQYWIWGNAANVFKGALIRLSPDTKTKLITKIFGQGNALGWLSEIMRSETFAQGRYGKRASPSECLFSATEYENIVSLMSARFKKLSLGTMLKAPRMMTVLFFWKQSGGDREASQWVHAATQKDKGLLEFLDASRNWSAINGKVYHPIRQSNISAFMDYEKARKRVEKLAKNGSKPINRKAKQILLAMNQDRET